jgi:thioredoxin-dependent peroxiredoxin
MSERSNIFTWKDKPVTLVGTPVKVGDRAPDAVVTANDLTDVPLSKWKSRIRVISSVPSLDTPVCNIQTRHFNEAAAAWGDNVIVLTISMDLPFAQKRWCGAAGVDRVVTLSDYKLREFGNSWGLYVKEYGLLARAVHVVDRDGIVRYLEITKDVGLEPSYDAALKVVASLTQ